MQSGSYARAVGVARPVYYDFFRKPVSATPHLGAVQ